MENTQIDESIKTLKQHKDKWARLPIGEKIDMINQMLVNLKKHSQEWIDVAIPHKQIDEKSPLVGEEWGAGIWHWQPDFRDIRKRLLLFPKVNSLNLKN